MKKVIQVLKIVQESELNSSELLVLCELCEADYLRINDMVERFGWNKRWAESNVAHLHKKGYLARSGQGNRYRLSKNGIHLCTRIFQEMHEPGAAYEINI